MKKLLNLIFILISLTVFSQTQSSYIEWEQTYGVGYLDGIRVYQNDVVNGDFENWTDGVADNWMVDGGFVTISQNTTTIQSGVSSCEVVWTSHDNQYLTSDPFNVTGGLEINASMWAYDNDISGRARLCIIYEGAENYYGEYSSDMDEWQQLVYTEFVPDGATSATFQIRFYDDSANWDGDATVIVDNAKCNVNNSPTNITLSTSTVDENLPIGTEVGILTSIDDDINDTHTYSFVSGEGDIDNNSFTISDDELLTDEIFDFEIQSSYSIRVQTDDGNGGTFSKSFIITISNENPIAAFSTDSPACLGAPINFYNEATSPNGYITEWEWDFGDGSDTIVLWPDNPNISHTYELDNTYYPTLTITNSNGYSNSISHDVVVVAKPIAAFNYSGTCVDVSFMDLSQENGGGDIVSWYWYFDDPASGVNNTSNLTNPTHLFSAIGNYFVDLIIENVNGCESTVTIEVVVSDAVNIDFTAADEPFCIEEVIQFTSTGVDIVFWLWDFDDGVMSISSDPAHVYINSGTYTVSLLVENTEGCEGYVEHDIIVNEDPVAAFSTNGSVCLGSAIEFTDYSTSPTGYITEWVWDFGDGSVITINFPDNPNVSHTYGVVGAFQTTLTVTNSNGCSSSINHEMIIINGPVVAFDYSGTCAESPVSFIDLSQENGGGEIVSWYWDFGDPASGVNNTSNLQNPIHIYYYPGSYSVDLIIENVNGCTSILNQVVIILDSPVVEIQVDNDTVCVYEPIYFTGLSTDAVIWDWDFGDGYTSNLMNPVHVYTSTGNFIVTLTVENTDGCPGYADTLIVVNENENNPPTDVQLSNSTVEEDLPIGAEVGMLTSTDEDTGDIHTYSLVSGEGATDNDSFTITDDNLLTDEVFDFETQSNYSIRLQTDDGNTGTYSESFTILITIQTSVFNSSINEVKLYPNPVKDKLFVNLEDVQLTVDKVLLFNSNGKLVFSSQGTELNSKIIEIPTLNYNTGLYILNLYTEKGIITRKISIIK